MILRTRAKPPTPRHRFPPAFVVWRVQFPPFRAAAVWNRVHGYFGHGLQKPVLSSTREGSGHLLLMVVGWSTPSLPDRTSTCPISSTMLWVLPSANKTPPPEAILQYAHAEGTLQLQTLRPSTAKGLSIQPTSQPSCPMKGKDTLGALPLLPIRH